MDQRSYHSPRSSRAGGHRRPQRNSHTYRNLGLPKRNSPLEIPAVRVFLFYILPFLAVNGLIFFLLTTKPSYEVVIGETHDYRTVDVTFTIKSHMPLKMVTLTMDSQPVDLTLTGKNTYTTTIDHNGVLEIYMENFNGMISSSYELVDVLDNETPDITSYSMEDGILTLTVSDSQSGINFDTIHGILPDGTQIVPLTVDKSTGTLTFSMEQDHITLSISDMTGNEYQPSFSVNHETEGADSAAEGEAGDASAVTLE